MRSFDPVMFERVACAAAIATRPATDNTTIRASGRRSLPSSGSRRSSRSLRDLPRRTITNSSATSLLRAAARPRPTCSHYSASRAPVRARPFRPLPRATTQRPCPCPRCSSPLHCPTPNHGRSARPAHIHSRTSGGWPSQDPCPRPR
ncbi:hypothetical protein OH77DRAFT_968243 [Trametes cingulata]|nr:hypothetical protein OH77DRAFT_968243 [Trametes cingulata]